MMAINPDTNKIERLKAGQMIADKMSSIDAEKLTELVSSGLLVRPDGSPVPKHWAIFRQGEEVVIKNYTFKVAYIGETAILFAPVSPIILDKDHTP
jgi:hypothetical protein